MRRFLPLLPLLAVACQPLPHPFSADMPATSKPAPVVPPDSADIVVAPVAGAPKAVGEALAAALRDADIPASTNGAGNRGSDHLLSTARTEPRNGRDAVILAWELHSADGRVLGRGSIAAEEPVEGWQKGDAAVAQDLAAKAAPAIAGLVQAPPPVAVAVAEPLLAMGPVTGAPGDGGSTLSRAMSFALNRAHVALADTSGAKESFILIGKVELSPPASGQQQVKVSWILRGRDGGEIGRIDQQNAVPAGSLDGSWGDIAFAVANAAAPGVAALIKKAKAEGVGAS